MEKEPEFTRDGVRVEHPLEHLLNASGWAILTAIERQRMSVMNVRGQLAEYYLNQRLEGMLARHEIQEFEWRLTSPDFSVMLDNRNFTMEVKNVRKEDEKRAKSKKGDPWWVEIQRTRDSKKGKGTRAYTVHHFDILAVCLFSRTGKWDHWFVASKNLKRRAADENLLDIHQHMPLKPDTIWHSDLLEAIGDAARLG